MAHLFYDYLQLNYLTKYKSYWNDIKQWGKNDGANRVDTDQTAPEEQSDQGLHYLPYCQQF